LRYWKDLPFRAIAHRLGMEEVRARVTHLRALRALAGCLSGKGYEPAT
jgi:hypothetical protein